MTAAVRAFVAVGLPQAYQDGLRRLREMWSPRLASRLTWTMPGNGHVTLAFLGNVAVDAMDGVRAALGAVAAAPFTLRAAGAGFFPQARPPRVVWAGLDQGGRELAGLSDAVWRSLAPLGFVVEKKRHAPHLTLARVKHVAPDPWDELARAVEDVAWPEIVVDRFSLWRSDLGPAGPAYTELDVFPLRGAA